MSITSRGIAGERLKELCDTTGLSEAQIRRKIKPGTLWRILNDPDYEPKVAWLRDILKLPILIQVPGKVCDYRHCKNAFPPKHKRHAFCCGSCGDKERYLRKKEAPLEKASHPT